MVTYDFIEKIGRINIRHKKKCLGLINEFRSETYYNDRLEKYFNEFKKEILGLPFLLNSKHSRKAFLNNLHDEFITTKDTLNEQLHKNLDDSYNKTVERKLHSKYYYPRFLRRKYLLKVRGAYQKMHLVCLLHQNKIDEALELLKQIALNDGIELNTIEEASVERIKSNLSSPELAYLTYLIVKKTANDPDFNRTHLSNMLADNFSTKKADAPRASQIRKHFTEVNDNVKSNIEKLLRDLSTSCMS